MCVFVNITSPFLDPTSCITRGSVLVSPSDSQSVLALQYKGIIVIFKKRPIWLGSVLCKPVCGTAQLEYMFVRACVWERVCMHVNRQCNPLYFHMETDAWLGKDGCLAMRSTGHLSGYKEKGRCSCFTWTARSASSYQFNHTAEKSQILILRDKYRLYSHLCDLAGSSLSDFCPQIRKSREISHAGSYCLNQVFHPSHSKYRSSLD